ncbi:MAG: ATP-dependent DNA helicase RecQ [Polyangiaceae bacterium]|nr:ATP-dependent DNA helicase RecQ [Polyangiaceae bacterium]MCW5788837.1 ATP-dependent DNA helicase RecQ [Polyangiaceae bacterium]
MPKGSRLTYEGSRSGPPPAGITGRIASSFELSPFQAAPIVPVASSVREAGIERAAERLGRRLSQEQRRLISMALTGRDTLTLLPSGSRQVGTALVAASMMEHPAIVVHPASTWLKVHHDHLTARGVPSVCLDDTLSTHDRRTLVERVRFARSLVVLVTPRMLQREAVSRALGQASVSLAVLIEAQLFSEFSSEFEPSSACLDDVLEVLGRPVVMAFSSVASAAVRSDLIDGLRLRDPVVFDAPVVRTNIRLQVLRCEPEARRRILVSELSALDPPGVVICSNPREVEAVHQALGALNIKSYRYHSGMPHQARFAEQHAFAHQGRRAVMVAESGFVGLSAVGTDDRDAPSGYGLGTCRGDLRYLIHFRAPASLEQYVRDLGLLGRDGVPAHALMLYSPEDLECYPARPSLTALTALLELLQRGEDVPVTVSELASRMSASEAATAELVEALVDAGLVVRMGGWVRRALSPAQLMKRGEFLLDQLETLSEGDVQRRAQVGAFASEQPEAGCRFVSLHRYLGLPGGEPCGVCDPCEANGASASSARVISRPAQRRFEVEVERHGTQLTTSGEPLGFKLRAAVDRER